MNPGQECASALQTPPTIRPLVAAHGGCSGCVDDVIAAECVSSSKRSPTAVAHHLSLQTSWLQRQIAAFSLDISCRKVSNFQRPGFCAQCLISFETFCFLTVQVWWRTKGRFHIVFYQMRKYGICLQIHKQWQIWISVREHRCTELNLGRRMCLPSAGGARREQNSSLTLRRKRVA